MSFWVSSLDIPIRTHNPGPIEDMISPPAIREDKHLKPMTKITRQVM